MIQNFVIISISDLLPDHVILVAFLSGTLNVALSAGEDRGSHAWRDVRENGIRDVALKKRFQLMHYGPE